MKVNSTCVYVEYIESDVNNIPFFYLYLIIFLGSFLLSEESSYMQVNKEEENSILEFLSIQMRC